MKKLKKPLSLFLTLLMCVNMLTLPAFADTPEGDSSQGPGTDGLVQTVCETCGEVHEGDCALKTFNTAYDALKQFMEEGDGDEATEAQLKAAVVDCFKALSEGQKAQLPEETVGIVNGLLQVTPADDPEPEPTYVAAIGEEKYETLQEAIKAANGDTVKLLQNTTVNPIEVNQTLNLDLGGYTLQTASTDVAGVIKVTGGKTTVSNGKIVSPFIGVHVQNPGAFELASDAEILLNGTGNGTGIFIRNNESRGIGTDITVRGKISGSPNSAIQGNGGDTARLGTINIESTADIEGGNVAIYHPENSTVNINGGTIIGRGGSAIATKAGTLNITGGTIQCTGKYTAPTQPFGNGALASGAAIQIETNSTSKYAGNIKIGISGDAQIISDHGNAIYQYGNEGEHTQLDSLEITGGTFTSGEGIPAVATEEAITKEQFTIKGGSFDSDVKAYLAEDLAQDASGSVKPADQVTAPFGTVAVVNGKPYTTLKDAIAAAEAAEGAQVVELLAESTGDVTVNKSITLKGGTINGTVTVTAGTLTLEGVTITATAGPGIAVTGKDVTLEVKGTNSVTSTAVNYAGIEVPMETSLTITGDGSLKAKGNGGAGVGGSSNGGVAKWLNGDITIDMTGKLEAIGTNASHHFGGYGGAGIGAASLHNAPADMTKEENKQKKSGEIIIKNGNIIAVGGDSSSGIGSSNSIPCGKITIYAGNIEATGSGGGAGIGCGRCNDNPSNVEVEIKGGTINATGGNWLAAGIGAGGYKGSANVTITGGDITAKGGNGNAGTTYQGAPGIGGGYQGGGTVNISGGKVNATGGNSAPGIGNGALASSSEVTITGGEITAQGGCNAPGIGGGNATKNVTVSITGGTIDAKGGARVGGTDVMPGIGSATKNDANKTGGKYEAATDATVTIGPEADLTSSTVGAPAGNKYYECTVKDDGSTVYVTTEHDANTVALLINGETTTPYSDLAKAISEAQVGSTVRLVTDIALARGAEIKDKDGKVTGYAPSLTVNKAITLDLNGKTLTLNAESGTGLSLSNHTTVTSNNGKGTIRYNGTANAITASGNGNEVNEISNLNIVGSGSGIGIYMIGQAKLGTVKDCDISSVNIGIKLEKVTKDDPKNGIQLIKGTKINANQTGIELYMSTCGLIDNCTITGGTTGIAVIGNSGDHGYTTSVKVNGGTVTGTAGKAVEISDRSWGNGTGPVIAEIDGTKLSGKDGLLIYSNTFTPEGSYVTVKNTNAVCCAGTGHVKKQTYYATYKEGLDKADPIKTITVLETNVDPGNYTMSADETLTSISGSIKAYLSAPAGYMLVESESEGTYTYTLRAAVPAAGVTLNRTTASVYTGNTVTLTATVTPDDADDKTVTWASSNPAVATVDANGVVRGVSNGAANITATVGSVSATCAVTVTTYVAPTTPVNPPYTGGGSGGGSYRPSGGGSRPSGGGTVNIQDPDVPLADLPMLFEDVRQGDWFYDAVYNVFQRKLMSGTSDTTFEPGTSTNRAMIVNILHRMEKTPAGGDIAFTDVAAGQWYTDSIAWAANQEIVSGYGDGIFLPARNITREQLASILYRYAAFKGYDVSKRADLSGYTDLSSVSDWAKDAMSWAVASGLISGTTPTTLNPQGDATRAQVAVILTQFCAAFAPDTGK